MKTIETLIPDIYNLLQTKGWYTEELAKEFTDNLNLRLIGQFNEQWTPTLRMSRLGDMCPKGLWHSIHTPERAEPLPPWAQFKYAYGNMIEALAITLAKAAGHTVAGAQDAVELDGIIGHRDCVIDGHVVDVKSSSSRSFIKFKNKSLGKDDAFGYLDQLDGYLVGSNLDPLVTIKNKGYLWAIDKQSGHMVLYPHYVREEHIRNRVREYKEIIALPEPPACTCKTIEDGASGNRKLAVRESYSPWKFCCFPLLRTFAYSSGPVYLTRVERVPDVPEITRYGKKQVRTENLSTAQES